MESDEIRLGHCLMHHQDRMINFATKTAVSLAPDTNVLQHLYCAHAPPCILLRRCNFALCSFFSYVTSCFLGFLCFDEPACTLDIFLQKWPFLNLICKLPKYRSMFRVHAHDVIMDKWTLPLNSIAMQSSPREKNIKMIIFGYKRLVRAVDKQFYSSSTPCLCALCTFFHSNPSSPSSF